MIPSFEPNGVLPPFDGNPGDSINSPYVSDVLTFVTRFATSPERARLLHGFLRLRARLNEIGFSEGFQWLNGSFCEDIEQTEGRAPGDIDLVTFMHFPLQVLRAGQAAEFGAEHADLFNKQRVKDDFLCDTFWVDLDSPPTVLIDHTKYWYGLFSHKRVTRLWKGMVELPLSCRTQNQAEEWLEAEYPR